MMNLRPTNVRKALLPGLFTVALAAFALCAPSSAAAAAGAASLFEANGDRAFAERSRLSARGLQAIAAYEEAVSAEPTNLTLRVKLLRALFFQAEYATDRLEERKELYERGRTLFEESYQLLANFAGRDTLRGLKVENLPSVVGHFDDAGPLYFWGAMHWGLWAESFGKVAAVRQGVIKKVRELSQGALLLAPTYEGYGPVRVLGRLHHLTPKVPILTGWVNRREAVDLLRRAVSAAPDEPLNPTFLAHALWQLSNDHRGALRLLREVIQRRPRTSHELEDRKAIDGAHELIARIESDAAKRRISLAVP
ncbi:MAG: hypothetical protein AAGK22_09100 [Acidobacteriota bacterium]